jgi:hypothetical protein
MPKGNGWQFDGKWAYDDYGYSVSSIFSVRAGAVRSFASCHYVLASENRTAEEWFDKDAAKIGGKVVETGQSDAGELIVDWAKISAEAGLEKLSGVCELAGRRRLKISVLEAGGETELAQNVFDRIVKSITYNDNGFLQSGERVVSEIKKAGVGEFVKDNQPLFLILSDSKGRAIGFTMDSIELQADKQSALSAASYFYRRKLPAVEQAGFYYGDVSFERFEWMFREKRPRVGRIDIEMSAESGVLTVRRPGISDRAKEHAISRSAVPDIVLWPVLKIMLENDSPEIVIDVIQPEGNVVPVYIEKANESDSNSLKIEVLDGSGYRQQIYYDDAAQPVKIVVEHQGTYEFNRATAEEIARAFPERAGLIHKQDRLLDREGI